MIGCSHFTYNSTGSVDSSGTCELFNCQTQPLNALILEKNGQLYFSKFSRVFSNIGPVTQLQRCFWRFGMQLNAWSGIRKIYILKVFYF